ncbi:MAG: hypothetical protein R3B13_12090 [Polyangiaceae bacterium]
MSVFQVGVLLACVATVGVVLRFRHATSRAAIVAASLAGGLCIFLVGASGLLDFSSGGAGRVSGTAAPLALGGYLLGFSDAHKKRLGLFVCSSALAAALPSSKLALLVVSVTFLGAFVWPLVRDRARRA